MTVLTAEPVTATWFLVGYAAESSVSARVAVNNFPFRVGRLPGLSLSLDIPAISKLHAEITLRNGMLYLRDLDSTNGTYLNGQRIVQPVVLSSGDLVQFAGEIFCLETNQDLSPIANTQHRVLDKFPTGLLNFEALLHDHAIEPHYQPIVVLNDMQRIGYESLARSNLEGLQYPGEMFSVASRLRQEGELSTLLRWEGVRIGKQLPGCPNLFVNTHPVELREGGLMESLRRIRDEFPTQPITLEIHEGSVTHGSVMKELQVELSELDIRLAYDDFGAGQARLVELVEVPPDFLKFDMRLIRDIDTGSLQRQQMLARLVDMVREVGIQAVAEGVETQAEAEICRQMGFDLAQGHFYGRPSPVEQIWQQDVKRMPLNELLRRFPAF